MANANSNGNGSLVAAYFRMSTDEQEGSIDAQRLLVNRFAADHGHRIVAEYIDAGIPGDATASQRPDFQRLMADSQTGKFGGILVRDTSRLTRSDSVDGAEELKPLKDAGVPILTTTGQRIDLRTMEGRILLHMGNEISNGENRNREPADGSMSAKVAERPPPNRCWCRRWPRRWRRPSRPRR